MSLVVEMEEETGKSRHYKKGREVQMTAGTCTHELRSLR